MLKELIIKIDNYSIYLSPELNIPIQQTNIPIEYCKFRSSSEIFWKVELLEFNSDNKCWKVKVIDYSPSDIKNFEHQKSTKEISRIAFEKFDWPKLEPYLSSYQKSKFLDLLDNHDVERFFREKPKEKLFDNLFPAINFSIEVPKDNLIREPYEMAEFTPQERKPITQTYEVEFAVKFSEARFNLGYVSFSKHIREFNKKVDFKISNIYILAEFENIKSWFSKKLKTKRFNVNAKIVTTDNKVVEASANSPQIALINNELVDSIKYQRTISLLKAPKTSNGEKSLYTIEEIFGEMRTESIEGNAFNQKELDILNSLLDHSKTRNRKQLEYLAGHKQSENIKLRFTLHPHFGFLFFIEGKGNNHFIWELLNSHATYLWSIGKSQEEIEFQYKRIEAEINLIRDTGREQYKKSYTQNNHDNNVIFSDISHDDITSTIVDGFLKWKDKLNEKTN